MNLTRKERLQIADLFREAAALVHTPDNSSCFNLNCCCGAIRHVVSEKWGIPLEALFKEIYREPWEQRDYLHLDEYFAGFFWRMNGDKEPRIIALLLAADVMEAGGL